ncbi:MAG TPA: cellulase family glycosylhydrolase, partial [Polyangiaceae bacterium]|nr:cellulase family glycosylhydrolase [Polyangiaceae bacterium]
PARYAGENYKAAIVDYVELLHRYGIVPILDLHWVGPGDLLAEQSINLLPMPSDHSEDLWADVAERFRDDDGVILEPFNEPFPDSNRDTPEAWACWRDGCDVSRFDGTLTYTAVGMQALVDAIRDAGSRHVLLLGGVQFSNGLSGWLEHKPNDPLENLGAAWHIYNNNPCRDIACWNGVPAELARVVPVVATEIGQNDCAGETFLQPLMNFLDENSAGYLAWSWNANLGCMPTIPRVDEGSPWYLVTDYVDPQPNSGYAQTFRDHLARVAP